MRRREDGGVRGEKEEVEEEEAQLRGEVPNVRPAGDPVGTRTSGHHCRDTQTEPAGGAVAPQKIQDSSTKAERPF